MEKNKSHNKLSTLKRTKLDHYHSPTKFRFDTWYALEESTQRLRDKYRRGDNTAKELEATRQGLETLSIIEEYTAFPSQDDCQYLKTLFDGEDYSLLAQTVSYIVRALSSELYRTRTIDLGNTKELNSLDAMNEASRRNDDNVNNRHYFEVLIVDDGSEEDTTSLRDSLRQVRRPEDNFIYDVVIVPSLEDALIAVMFNYNIQACVIRYGFPLHSKNHLELLQQYLTNIDDSSYEDTPEKERGPLLADLIRTLRPELDLYLVTNTAVEDLASRVSRRFRRIFYRQKDHLELHLNILRGIQDRYQTPFFTALREYSRQPTGVFHAMPISRGKSITKSHWIQDMLHFYGMNIFLAETSTTSGGLDSLLQPHGPIKKAQELAARAFGAKWTFFVTNGTSTSNKIVVQALVRPDDIVLIDRDCHKSHHYGMVLSGARVSYLDSYPLHDYSMYGAVPIREMKERLLQYREAGLLDKVRMLLLTNCTFDGVVYNVERIMEECLAIKPDLIFLWDEAWFAFAGCVPTYRKRTAMATAARLLKKYRTDEYRAEYEAFAERTKDMSDEELLHERLMPDPDKVRIRVYATQSTHKSLTSLRQGSMIHVYDQDFKHKVRPSFTEAFMTHTSTSPNYQILASLDVGRRQVELEGFEMVQHQLELAMALRERVAKNPLISKYFRFLVAKDLIPAEYRQSGIESYYSVETGWANSSMEQAWDQDDFVIDPTRLTLYLGKTGIDGDTFKNEYLMDKYGIQINKTSRNTVLFMTNIGTTRSSVAFLLEVLVQIATELDRDAEDASQAERLINQRRIKSLSEDLPPLPDFSRFSPQFLRGKDATTPDGKIRDAYFLAAEPDQSEYFLLDDGSIEAEMAKGRDLVSATFVIPYPPGFPILVPGQVISKEILDFMRALDVKEIHGYQVELGLQVLTEEVLAIQAKKQ